MPGESRAKPFTLLLHKPFWREMGQSLKRVHKDRRARKQVLSFALFLLVPVLIIAYAAFLVGSGAWLFLPFVIPVLWWRQRSARRDAQPLNIAPRPELEMRTATVAEKRAVREYFSTLALLYAVLMDRAGSERYLKEKELPDGTEPASRRLHLDLLRKYGVWDRISVADRDVMAMPDGAWDLERINRLTTAVEPLRLLRWLLRIDYRLPAVGHQLYGDFTIAHEIVTDPRKAVEGSAIVDVDVVRQGRDLANRYSARCIAELIDRGFQAAPNEQTAHWAKAMCESLKGKQNEDLVLGDVLVSEADPGRLSWAATLATIRTGFLNEVIAILEKMQVPEDPITSIYARG